MDTKTMARPFTLFLCLLTLFSLALAGYSRAANFTYYFRDASVEGFLLVDKRLQVKAEGSARAEKAGRVRFCRELLAEYKYMLPLNGASVAFAGDESTLATDGQGHFRLTKGWAGARGKQLKISAPQLNLAIQLNFEDSLRNVVLITVSQEGRITVFCLDEGASQNRKTHPVALVDEYGGEALFSIFSASSWKDAHDLFSSDPDLSKFDFYMPVLGGDRNAVESSLKLGAFLRMLRLAYGNNTGAIVLAHSTGGIVVRHYTVSSFFEPGSVSRFLMLATPNAGRLAGMVSNEPAGAHGGGSATGDFINCLNNAGKLKVGCRERYLIEQDLQSPAGLNPSVPCAILAGDVKGMVASGLNMSLEGFKDLLNRNFGPEAAEGADNLQIQLNKFLDKVPPGDVVVSLQNQLIKDVPFQFLPYAHGFLHRPRDRDDDRYVMMKRFILTGDLTVDRYLK